MVFSLSSPLNVPLLDPIPLGDASDHVFGAFSPIYGARHRADPWNEWSRRPDLFAIKEESRG
jgi:hypothetical protein